MRVIMIMTNQAAKYHDYVLVLSEIEDRVLPDRQ
jgi:hypothetical protein